MDSNNLYQNQQTGTDSNGGQTGNVYQNGDGYQSGNAYQSGNDYQSGNTYQNGDGYQSGNTYQNNDAWQQPAYNQYDQGGYNSGDYGNGNYNGGNSYNNGNYSNGNYSNGNYNNGNYGGSYNGGYGNGGYQPYQQQLDLEEPVKMSEWLISMLLMMVPCVNIVMMFVWAFSKTEKKSKSNFFKAYLIMFGVVFALYLVIVIFIAATGLLYW